MITKLARLNMRIYNIDFKQAKKKARNELAGIRTMLKERYGFKK